MATDMMVLPDNSKGTVSNRSVGLVIRWMYGGWLCGVVRLLLSVEKLLRSAGLLVVADRTVRRALHQRHWHPRVSARADHSHNRTSVMVNPRIQARGFRSHWRPARRRVSVERLKKKKKPRRTTKNKKVSARKFIFKGFIFFWQS